ARADGDADRLRAGVGQPQPLPGAARRFHRRGPRAARPLRDRRLGAAGAGGDRDGLRTAHANGAALACAHGGLGMTPRKILVTGATGFIGSRLCELLSLEYRLPYRALVRDFSRAVRIARLDVELMAGDMLDADSLARAVAGCDAVVNLAHGDDKTTKKQTTNLVDACTRAGVRRLVHVSSMAVHVPSPGVPVLTEATAPIKRWGEAYSDAKAAGEAVVTAAGTRGALETVVLRPTIVYGPYSFFVTPIAQYARAGHVSLVDGGRGLCNAVYVDDVCEAILAAL